MQDTVPRQSIPVVIFCGGKGSRLKEETEFRPKPMVTVGGRPILWHIMKGYAHQGYNRFILCLGYKGQMIKDYFLNHRVLSSDFHLDAATGDISIRDHNGRDDFQILFVDTGEDTLTAERLMRVSKYIDTDQFMLTYGDGVSDVDVRALHAHHDKLRADHGVIGTVTGVHPRSKYGLVETDARGVVTQFRQKPILKDYTNGGFMVMHRDFFSYLKPGEMVEDALIAATAAGKIGLYNYEGFWHCMDTYQDMEELNKMWNTDPKWKIWS